MLICLTASGVRTTMLLFLPKTIMFMYIPTLPLEESVVSPPGYQLAAPLLTWLFVPIRPPPSKCWSLEGTALRALPTSSTLGAFAPPPPTPSPTPRPLLPSTLPATEGMQYNMRWEELTIECGSSTTLPTLLRTSFQRWPALTTATSASTGST